MNARTFALRFSIQLPGEFFETDAKGEAPLHGSAADPLAEDSGQTQKTQTTKGGRAGENKRSTDTAHVNRRSTRIGTQH